MASNRYQLITGNTLQPESPVFPPLDSSPLNSQRDPVKETQAIDEDNISPLMTMRTATATDREDAGLTSKPVETELTKPAEGATKRAPRKRFYSHTPIKPTPVVTDSHIPAGRLDTFQNEAESIGTKIEDNESPILKDASGAKRDSTRPLRPSRFRKTSFDFRGSLETDDEESPGLRPSGLSDLLENRSKKLGSSAHSLIRKVTLSNTKQPATSLTFDAFVDKRKGVETIKTNYPTYKTDKRLIFLGKRFKYPTFVIPSKSLFRKIWNFLIIVIILYQVFWHPLDNTFLVGIETPKAIRIFEWLLLLVFLIDVEINIRTTYSNENNEEIIDLKMIRRNYMKKIDFIFDLITLFPIGEILYHSFPNEETKRLLYSVPKLLTFLRLYKLKRYKKSLTFNSLFKVIKIFIAFFLMVHWASCLWYLVVKNQYYETEDTEKIWYPNNLRMIAEGPEDLIRYYHDMDIPEIYAYTMLAIFMLVVGSDNAPVNQVQVYITVVIGLLGAISLAYVFGLVTYIINRANESTSEYEHQLEGLKKKLKANKIPINLRIKVLEYYTYTWRKHRILHKLNDFSELSIPLQRDLAFYQNQKLVTKVPLFQELEPLEILSIIQKLKTCVYMPGDKIIREGERGTEMYFVQEGVVEIIVKVLDPQVHYTQQTPTYNKTYLGKESYFGEIALMSRSKRTSDANAFEFCILESFSRSDYNSLKKEFPDIGPRLKSGLKYYKSHRKEKLMCLLQPIPIFDGVTESELKLLIEDYTEEFFMDPNKIILRPKEKTNAIYFLFSGNVCCYADHLDTREYLIQLKKAGQGDKAPAVEEDDELDCLDDNIHDLEKDKTSIEDQKKKLKLVKAYTEGGYFGNLDFGENPMACEYFYVSESGCEIGAITQELLEELMEDNVALYEKLRNNQLKHYPKITMQAIQEEAECSVSISIRNSIHSLIPRRSLKHIKDSLNKLDMHKLAQGSANGSATHLEEEFANFKGQFGRMQTDVDNLKFTMNSINFKLSKLLALHDIKEDKKSVSSLALRKRNSLNIEPIHLFDQTRRSKPSIEEASERCEESPSFPKPQQL